MKNYIENESSEIKKPKVKPKFIIEEIPQKLKVIQTQTFQEKLKQKGSGLKIALETSMGPLKVPIQDKACSASPILSVL